MSMQAECDLANFDGTDTTRFCNGACNAALNTVSNGCSASVTEEAEAKQNADMNSAERREGTACG